MIWGIGQCLLFILVVLALTKPMGAYMAHVYAGENTLLDPILRPLERLLYRVVGIDPNREMRWTSYTLAFLAFSVVSAVILYAILRLQGVLPLNPQGVPGMCPDLAFNTAVSFMANTNWQAYAGEQTASYFSQMVGLAWQNFMSAAAGMAIAIALIRGLTRRSVQELGNFWVDLTRSVLWVLLPLSILLALVLISQGVIQNFAPYQTATTLESARQVIPMGPVASQEAIKELGTNGGGFFNANSAHPFENPTPLSNFLELVAIFLIPAGFTYTFGRYAKDQRQGWALFAAMGVLFLMGLAVIFGFEQAGNPVLARLGVDQQVSVLQSGGNMEGKEVRFGIANSAHSMHDSYTPLAGGMAMLNIALGELVYGGVGVGFAGMIIFALLAVFIAGLMVGRTPEYLGKKIESKEMKMAMLYVLVTAASILGFSALAVVTEAGLAGRMNMGPHGLSEILYAYHSGTGNNGSAFAGLTANTPFYNTTIGLAMLIGRFLTIIPLMAIAGSLAGKTTVPATSGTFPTTGGLFIGLLVGVILIVGALTFFPAYALGPVVEHFQMQAGRLW
ncbi:MAG: Potassium-transporting ATPase A chain [bacterium ADurb.Bin429]|nr:MAG: Potassium-transporting ATPase A chain [bacterium ADurb.Bin429]